MRRLAIIAVVLGFAVWASAQQPAPAQPQGQSVEQPAPKPDGRQPQKEVQVPNETRIPVVLRSTLDASKAKVGDPVHLQVVEDVRTDKQTVLIPRKALLRGKVTEVKRRTKGKSESLLSLVVLQADWPGNHAQLHAFIASQINLPNETSIVVYKVENSSMPAGVEEFTLRPPPPPPVFRVRTAADPDIGSEVFSAERDVLLPEGTRFVVKNWTR